MNEPIKPPDQLHQRHTPASRGLGKGLDTDMKRIRKSVSETPDNRRILYYEERQAVHTPANLSDRAAIAKEIDYILQALQVQGGRELHLAWDAKERYFVIHANRTRSPQGQTSDSAFAPTSP